MKLLFGRFTHFNLKGCIDRADDLLIAVQSMQLSHEDGKALCDAQMLTARENGDMWESLAWHMAYVELFERLIRDEDPTFESPPPGWNGGFTETFNQPATEPSDFKTGAASTKFAIETSAGFLGLDGQYNTALRADQMATFDWLEQSDQLTEAMEEIATTKNASFRVICIEPFNQPTKG